MARTTQRPGGTAPRSIARHGRLRPSSPLMGLLQLLGAALVVVLVSGLAVAGITVQQLEANIDTVALDGDEGGVPAIGDFEGGFNVLIVGIDENYDRESVLNDVNILVHVSADHTNATAVSFPRDLVVPIPSCPREDGEGRYASMSARPLNEAYYYGGLPCVALTIEELTGLDIPFAAMTTFNGVVNMSTAVGGVTVCTTGPLIDRYSGINLPSAGDWTLLGQDALAFLRSRHGVGDGSDLGRISSQQVFLSALVRKVTAEGVLDDPAAIYRLATAATQSMTLSTSMTNITTLVAMAQVFRNMSLDRITFVQYPSTTGVGGVYEGKVAPVRSVAEELMERLQNDQPVVAEETGRGSVSNPEATTPPTNPETPTEPEASATPSAPGETAAPEEPEVIEGLLGQSAAQNTCSKVNN
ncbi:LCP family protein [Salinibacterium sp. SYSU T00001]|uniref:LCP family protein n=1 Tax=Homoserinimonas sedimenticola TaxID=2986805 RepID=UPI002235D613|nr:LCP family protein [Salinibacterium sedimenticola]MCW4385892.1 LCP family protein [Salinibacterium sedimenticola]